MPAADAGGHELTSEYYVDGQARKQVQNGQTNTYYIDPAGRVRKTVGEGTTNLTTIDHYGCGGEALTWKDEGSGKYTRLIPGIDGSLSGVQTNGGTPVLQLHDLQGNVAATAALSETETKLLSTYNSTEFGVQVNGPPPTKYSWLGADGVSSELSSGTLIMGTVAYVPQLGRPLETQAVIPPGMAINGAQGVPYIAQASAWSIQALEAQAQVDGEIYEAELQKAAEQEAQEKACAIASMCVTPEEATSGPMEDPTGILWWKATEARADMIQNWANEIGSDIENFNMDTGSDVGLILSEQKEYEKVAAHELRECASKVKHMYPPGVCWMSYSHYEQFLGTPGFVTFLVRWISPEACTWKSGHTPKHEWFHCPVHGNYAG